MNEVQGKFRVVVDETYEELIDRLKKPKSPKFIIVDSYQVSEWEYPDAVALMKRFPKKCFIWISQEKKSQPMGRRCDPFALYLRHEDPGGRL